MPDHARSLLGICTEATIGIIFGILTLTATVASIRYKDSIFTLVLCLHRGSVWQRGPNDLEAHQISGDTGANPFEDAFELRTTSTFLDWPMVPSLFDVSEMERNEWADERQAAQLEDDVGAAGPTRRRVVGAQR